jgi:hypothetical protein
VETRLVAGNGAIVRALEQGSSAQRLEQGGLDPDPLYVEPEIGLRADHQLGAGERVVAMIGLFFALVGIGLLVTTFGAIAAFWIGLAGGWVLRDIDRYLANHGG